MEALVLGFIELPEWLTLEFVLRIMDSKIFSAVYWGAAAIVAVIGFIARMKYRDRNLKRLLDAYVDKAKKADGHERQSVKVVISRAISKARGLVARGSAAQQFSSSDVFENTARFLPRRHHSGRRGPEGHLDRPIRGRPPPDVQLGPRDAVGDPARPRLLVGPHNFRARPRGNCLAVAR